MRRALNVLLVAAPLTLLVFGWLAWEHHQAATGAVRASSLREFAKDSARVYRGKAVAAEAATKVLVREAQAVAPRARAAAERATALDSLVRIVRPGLIRVTGEPAPTPVPVWLTEDLEANRAARAIADSLAAVQAAALTTAAAGTDARERSAAADSVGDVAATAERRELERGRWAERALWLTITGTAIAIAIAASKSH
jgi:hypothetical protein